MQTVTLPLRSFDSQFRKHQQDAGFSLTLYLYIDSDPLSVPKKSSQLFTNFDFSRYDYDAVKQPITAATCCTNLELTDKKEQTTHEHHNRTEDNSKNLSRSTIDQPRCKLVYQSKLSNPYLFIPYLGVEMKIRLIACFSICVTMRLMLYLIRITHTISRLISNENQKHAETLKC